MARERERRRSFKVVTKGLGGSINEALWEYSKR